jgi:hypothetical protein
VTIGNMLFVYFGVRQVRNDKFCVLWSRAGDRWQYVVYILKSVASDRLQNDVCIFYSGCGEGLKFVFIY